MAVPRDFLDQICQRLREVTLPRILEQFLDGLGARIAFKRRGLVPFLAGPLVASMVYIETLPLVLDPVQFATYTNLPAGSTAKEKGFVPAAIEPVNVRAPVVASMVYMETLFEPKFVT